MGELLSKESNIRDWFERYDCFVSVNDKLCEKDFFTYNPGRASILGLKTCRNIHKDNRNKKTFKLYLADSKFESENFEVFPYSVLSS